MKRDKQISPPTSLFTLKTRIMIIAFKGQWARGIMAVNIGIHTTTWSLLRVTRAGDSPGGNSMSIYLRKQSRQRSPGSCCHHESAVRHSMLLGYVALWEGGRDISTHHTVCKQVALPRLVSSQLVSVLTTNYRS